MEVVNLTYPNLNLITVPFIAVIIVIVLIIGIIIYLVRKELKKGENK